MPTVEHANPSAWDWSGDRLMRDGDPALPFNVRPKELLADERGVVRGYVVDFVFPDKEPLTVSLPTSVLRVTRPADVINEAAAIDVQHRAAQVIVALLDDVRLEGDLVEVPTRTVITHPEWRGDQLNVPGSRPAADWLPELTAYGHTSDIEERLAVTSWQEIVETALEYPKALVTIGMPIGSIYCQAFKTDTFALHLTGESHSGKTESAEIGMSALSSARRPHGRLYRTWDFSAQAPTNLLKLVGPLPVWFDETGVFGSGSDRKDEAMAFTNLIFRLAQGRGRLIADTSGGLRSGSGDRWDACVLSTGEARLSNKSGLTGLRRRVLEIYAPVMRDRESHDRALSLARQAHGWPLRWLTIDPELERTMTVFEAIFGALAEEARSQQVEVAQATNLAMTLTGFWTIGRLCGRTVNTRDLTQAGAKVFSKLQAAADDEGSDVGERGLRAVKEAIQTTSNFHAPEQDLFIYRWGVIYEDGYVGILGEQSLARILREAGLNDAQPVLEKWDEAGILLHDDGRYTGRRPVYVPGAGTRRARMYLVKVR